MADIFISYASEDRSRAEPLANALQEQGWSVWWDKTIPPGKSFDEVIEEAINSARCIVVLWSKTSIHSDWVKEEADIGKQRKILVPAKIDPVDPPLGFGRIQAADLTNWETKKEHAGFLGLQKAITEVAGPPAERDESVQDTKLTESDLEQQRRIKSEEKETFHPDTSQPKPVEKESPSTGSKLPRKKQLAYGIGAVALISVLSVIGWLLFREHTITVSYKPDKGSIFPSDSVAVPHGGDKEFEIIPKPDYGIADITVDGKSVGRVSSYTIKNVTNDQTILAKFYKNLALEEGGAKAEQSSTWAGAKARRAIDGNTDGNFFHDSVTHTADKPNSSWQVELPSAAIIERIVVWNRTDCCGKRLSNFRISVLNDTNNTGVVWDYENYERIGESRSFEVDPPVLGQVIKVEKIKDETETGMNMLSLAEVQVFGEFKK